MSILDSFPSTVVSLQTNLGSSSVGTVFADPVPIPVFAEDARKNVRNSTGELTVSETTLYDDNVANAALWAGGSKVTVNGRPSLVIIVKRRIIGDPDVDHIEIAIT